MLTAPQYSRVGNRCADGEIETLELNTPKTSPQEERHHGALPHLFIPDIKARKYKNITLLQKRIENKLGTK